MRVSGYQTSDRLRTSRSSTIKPSATAVPQSKAFPFKASPPIRQRALCIGFDIENSRPNLAQNGSTDRPSRSLLHQYARCEMSSHSTNHEAEKVSGGKGVRHEWHCPRRFFVFSRDFFPLRAALKDVVYRGSKIGILFASLKISSLV